MVAMGRDATVRAREEVMTHPTVIQFLANLRPALPMSAERPCTPMSNGELRRHLKQGGVLINGQTSSPEELLDFPVFSLVFFPKGARRTTLV